MKNHDLWDTLRGKARVIFPVLSLVMAAVILTCPLYPRPLSLLCENAFARFCLFWCLAVFLVLALARRRMRPMTVALIATLAAALVGVAFWLICVRCLSMTMNLSKVFLSMLSGAILGALAGTWLIYVFQVYSPRRG